jgi:2,3-diaminopropionate biosynthesis protein SbnB
MRDGDILILKAGDVRSVTEGREADLIDIVRRAYEAHSSGESSLPHSLFLRFPDEARNRIIALPAYLGGDFDVAGIKWVSSFPANVEKGLDRASAVIILNSTETGRPLTVAEASIISAKRTAASAALAAKTLRGKNDWDRVGFMGCGLINFEIARFLTRLFPGIRRFVAFDTDAARVEQFNNKCRAAFGGIEVEAASDPSELLRKSRLFSFATTATTPHISSLSECKPGSVILHVSLRDLAPEAILSCDNVVDDVDHVCRAQTSVHLAEQLTGGRDFIRCTLADILQSRAASRKGDDSVVVFSPFGLGVLDVAVAKWVCDQAIGQGIGTFLESFLPDSFAAV